MNSELGELAFHRVSFEFAFLSSHLHSIAVAKRPVQPGPKSKFQSKPESKPESKSTPGPWYADGLRFECTQCGECCSGEPGYVFVDESEIDGLAGEMKLDRDAFEDKFLRRVGNQFSLLEYPDGDCIFLDPKSRRCLVYNARPIQCRTWPFWDSTLAGATDWQETCEVCPGAGKGKLYSFDEIEIRRKEKSV